MDARILRRGVEVERVFGMAQVGLEVTHRRGGVALGRVGQTTVAVLAPGIGQERDQAVLHGDGALPVFLRPVHFLQVAQQT
jgi:hypothetical protein